jgi:hypothetical protein
LVRARQRGRLRRRAGIERRRGAKSEENIFDSPIFEEKVGRLKICLAGLCLLTVGSQQVADHDLKKKSSKY